MTDTGQVPSEGLPESAGMVEQPGAPAAHGTYTYLSETTAEDEDLLMPGSQGAWGNEVAPPAPEPVLEAVHEPGPHEISGRDSGSVDLSGVRFPNPTPPSTPIPPITPRRPLHLGPPIPDASASPVRSLADRGAVGAPARHPGATGPEYLDVQQHREASAPQAATPWGAPAPAPVSVEASAAETVVPTGQPVSVAQAVAAGVATDAVAAGSAPQGTADGAQATASDVPLGAEAGVVVPQESVQDGQLPSAADATPVVGVEPVVGEMPGGAQVPGVEELPDAAQAPGAGAAPGQDAGQPAAAVDDPTAGEDDAAVMADSGAGTVEAIPSDADGGEVPVSGVAPDAGQVPGASDVPDAVQDAGAGDAPEDGQSVEPEQLPGIVPGAEGVPVAGGTAGDGAQAVGAGDAQASEVPVAAEAPGEAAPEAASAGEAAVAEAGDVAETAVPETVQAVAVPAAESEPELVATPAEGEQAFAPPAAEAEQVLAAPAAEAEQVFAAPAAEAEQVFAPPAAEGEQTLAAPAPEAAQALAAPAPEATQPLAVPAPEADQVPETPVVDAEQTLGVPSAEAAQVADAVVPEALAQGGEEPAPQGAPVPEAVSAAEAAQVAAEGVIPAQGRPTPEAAPDPTASEPAPAPRPADAEQVGQVPHPADDASAVVSLDAALDPTPHSSDAEQTAQQQAELSAPVVEPLAEPNLAQVQPPDQDGTPTDADAAVAAQAVAASTPVAEAEAHIADPAGQLPAAQQTPDLPAESPDPRQSPADAAPAEAPEPFVAEPAGPQLRSVAQSAQALPDPQDPTQPPVGPTEFGGEAGDATAVLPSATPLEPTPDQSLGQFVPVEGLVPTTPHLAPTPPQPILLPVEETPATVVMVPAPREGDPELVQHAEDLDTRAADQEDPQEESTAAVEEVRQSTGPAAPAYDDAEREAVLKVMRERRDIRNGFRSDPIPHEVLLRVLEAAHTAPSVGHSQPWDFVVIRSAETRRTMHELAQRQREAYAKSLPKGRAKQFKELKIEAILDTPVNIVVTADPTRGGRHTLGRHTQPQMAPYSAALAVENLWLAARAEGLGVGWVSFFDEREMVRALGLPEHLEVIAYLCVGYVDEFPDEPELMQAGWSKRRPLSWVVHEETYGRRALPGEEPHDLLGETVAQIRPLDAKALGEAWERQKRMTKPAGALGMLEIISAQLSGLSRQCPPPIPEPAAVAIFAGDHGVHAQGVTPWPQEVTAQMVANFLGGGAVCNAFAGQVGAEVCVVDVGVVTDLPATPGLLPRKVRAGTSDMTTGPAMTREEAKQAIEVGIETARDLVAAGNKALLTGEMGIANTTASAALISVFTDTDPAEVTGRGTGINDETLARKTEVVRRAIELHQPDPADPIGVLAAIGGFEHAAMVGLLLGGASLRTPVILDGVSAGAAALVARAIAPEVLAACIAGHRSAEPGHVAALNKLGLRPLVDLDLRLGEGTGALLALPLVQSTARAMHEVATFDSAGVTEK
ncbi:nicotinate-nucleotide-dimethylbenzimidazole phosphoribosyltransferase /cob(II)yrinic acid a,c-diamide reductase [Streptomyces sp. cf386]|uniref:nicotinate-nucleotide--dimethylbenzimidazole phosphoribosyltransferase n=1 Tax=Streptomyces sp. cf386 TaxID=1761904 RepID=UPI00087F7571|nr:nicotinate-nucleotide--dimethylbenzimidazole phosphoribosyltransferase [Streptomyces sp. cf386]SDO68281.1 nicotinate-nucleotide-dimethylbenzimidazole phosphoribosyltransferase /cob(II)yrinic acid a,c-diamide reductase [Streptomyces sp. cf386]